MNQNFKKIQGLLQQKEKLTTRERQLMLKVIETQNRELEIESSLEQVRTIAMSMKDPADMLQVCKTISLQLQSLGVQEIRNVQTAIFYENRGTYMNYEYYAKHDKTFITETIYTDHKIAKAFAAKMIKGKGEFFSTNIKGQKVKDWIEYQKTTNVFIDRFLEKASSLNYYWHSLGPVALGISTYTLLSKDDLNLLKPFLNVFELAYTRYLDIELALAQAKEARIELALERVRARAMAMQNSNELAELVSALFKELTQLDFTLTSCIIWMHDHEQATNTLWIASAEMNKPAQPFRVQPFYIPFFKSIIQAWKAKDSSWIYSLTGSEKKTFEKAFFKELPNLPDPLRKALKVPKQVVFSASFNNFGALEIAETEALTDEKFDILHRFGKVFDSSYTRFNDLKKAEAQAREAKIEAALERVRSRSMGMQKSEELKEVIHVVYEQFVHLNIKLEHAGFVMDYKTRDDYDIWVADPLGVPSQVIIPYFDSVYYNRFNEAKEKGEDFFATNLSFEEKNRFYKKLFEYIPGLPEKAKKFYFSCPGLAASTVLLENVCLYIENFSGIPYTDEENNTLMRFGKVFQQTYTRFLDLKKAESQAREAQIELGLERVRARAMAMQKSDELSELVDTVFKELTKLDFALNWCIINIIDEPSLTNMVWAASPETNKPPESYLMKFEDYPFHHSMMKGYQERKTKHVYVLEGKEKKTYDDYLFIKTEWRRVPKAAQAASRAMKRYVATFTFSNFGGLQTVGEEYLSEENLDILSRFGKVFDLTYTRFNDLKQAEAQAREAKIEAALERTRTQSMIMQHSKELDDSLRVFHQQVLLLGINSAFSFLWLPDEDKDRHIFWAAWAENNPIVFRSKAINYPLDRNEPATAQCLVDWKSNEPVYSYHVPPAAVENYFAVWNELIAGVEQLKPEYFSEGLYYVEAFMKYGCFGVMVKHELKEEEKKILARVAIEFERTYTRFLDLQKAEAQAREAQIETGLERVRSRTLAMHKSEELAETAAVLFNQLFHLGIAPNRLYIGIIKDQSGEIEAWATDEDGSKVSKQFTLSVRNYSVKKMYDAWKEHKKSITIDMQGKELEDYLHYLHDDLNVPFRQGLTQKRRVQNIAFFSKGFIGIASQDPQSEETSLLLERFASVFNLTFTRFNDLQIAEAQTHKANIETALERVRARALAMQQPEELTEVAQVMRQEMGLLGVEELETSSIYIHDDTTENTECWYAIKDIMVPEKKLVADHFKLNLHDTWVGRQMFDFYNSKEKHISIPMKGANRKEWIEYCSKQSKLLDGFYGEVIPDRIYHLYKFSNGTIGAATPGNISAESWELLQRAASVFSLAYSRFKDLTQASIDLQKLKEEKQRAEDALTELQAAQKQLIQSEKMASLGELTAGIAHEIQNPLNFVNNFSEVSGELISEMVEEVDKGNYEEVKAIADDVKQNLEKINHHGNRAAAIVKGMLQHSRSGSGKKEPTDINALADEYLRLAYHGLRAKDKSFNATMKTDFDESIGNINIIPQDIGRVILNLITNAFYVVDEKKKSGVENYEPTVTVSTSRSLSFGEGRGEVRIIVKDNGNGIPQKVLDKIFQPFFTTKPTGQGTGLGLSLSYDILKAHGGEIIVDTIESKGTEFTIYLPFQ